VGLALLDTDNKLHRDVAIMRAVMEELHTKLARIPTRSEFARAALGIIFSTAVVITLLNWWLLAR
jgi:hypothetical protein